jgi:hypothetical protein
VTELPFQGLRVFLPRNYVPPEKFPALHDLLMNNGAEVCPILNASCNSNVDFHVMADNQTVCALSLSVHANIFFPLLSVIYLFLKSVCVLIPVCVSACLQKQVFMIYW